MNIMIIDQSVLIRKQLDEMLGELPGIRIICDSSGPTEALLFPFLRIVDIVILDIATCGGECERFIAQLKHVNSALRVIGLCDQSGKTYQQFARTLGADLLFDKANEFNLLPEAILSGSHAVKSLRE